MLEIRCRYESDALVLELEGNICISTAPVLTTSLEGLLACRAEHLILDLQAVTLLTAEGIGVIIRSAQRAHGSGGRLSVRGATGLVAEVLHLTGVSDLLALDQRFSSAERAHGMTTTRWLTLIEASDLLGVDPNRVNVMAGQGLLPSQRVGRATMFDPDDILRCIEDGTRGRSSLMSNDRQSAS